MRDRYSGERWLKSRERRFADVSGAAALLGASMPVRAAIIAAIQIEGNGESPYFTQKREVGTQNEFQIKKFRTLMPGTPESDNNGHIDDPRATRVGALLRPLRLDELPQLGLVLAGKMSLVGPRPLVPDAYIAVRDSLSTSEYQDWLRARSVCKPGIMDLYGATHYGTTNDFYEPAVRAECDVEFVNQASPAMDLRVIAGSARVFGVELGLIAPKTIAA